MKLRRIVFFALSCSRLVKQVAIFFMDLIFCIISLWFSFYLRLGDFYSLSNLFSSQVYLCSFATLFATYIYKLFGIYNSIFRHNGASSLLSIAKATFLYGLLFSSIFTIIGFPGVPRTIGLIQPIIFLLLVIFSRISLSFLLSGLQIQEGRKHRILIYGAGAAGRQLSAALSRSNEFYVVGFLDDDPLLHGRYINSRLIYNPFTLKKYVYSLKITEILLAIPSAPQERRNQILSYLSSFQITVRTLPSLNDIVAGKITVNDICELDLNDLLGREPVRPIESLLNENNSNKTVVVTGAGGSIGSELCRQILKTRPTRLLLIETNEFALYCIHQELLEFSKEAFKSTNNSIDIVPLLASVCDENRINEIMQTWKPNTVYHAAAYKHVPIVEHNPIEGIRNNVIGTMVCAEASIANHVNNFVLISTDKAVRPTNIMGASKRLAEMILQALAAKVNSNDDKSNISFDAHKTHLTIVRFGNVLGSSGSVVPLFRNQIKNGGPITLTHPDITRYFMTIPEAAQLVIQAGAIGKGGDVFVLDMGEPIKIYDLAKRIITLSGLTASNKLNSRTDIEIKIIGLRPGEKLYEELLIGNNPQPTIHTRIFRAHESHPSWSELIVHINVLRKIISENNVSELLRILKEIIPEYKSNSGISDWIFNAKST